MIRKMSACLILSITLLTGACGPSSSSQGQESAGLIETQKELEDHADEPQDHFTFRDSETNEILPENEIPGNQMRAQYSYITGAPTGWPNGVLKWWYNPTGQPANMTTQQVIDGLIASTKRWETVCRISFQYQGTTSNNLALSSCNGATVIGWTALAGSVIGQTQVCYSRTSFTEMDLGLDNTQIGNIDLMKTVAVHEFGHAFGLGHTTTNPAVMTPSLTTGLPVQDDINGCQSIYGVPTTTLPPLCTSGTTQACAISNGTGQQTCSGDGRSWSSCSAVTCQSGYVLKDGACVAQSSTMVCKPNTTRYCSANNGTGYRSCSSDGMSWSACKITQCRWGYRLVNGTCQRR